MKRPGDDTPEPPGGHAAERLRQFEKSRHVPDEMPVPDEPLVKPPAPDGAKVKREAASQKRRRREKQNRRKK
jgi:hypothetical protein